VPLGGGGWEPAGFTTTVNMLDDVLPLLPSVTVALAGNVFLKRLKVLGLDSLFTRLLPESVQPPAASQPGLAKESLAAT
jgi:hypothetical protein